MGDSQMGRSGQGRLIRLLLGTFGLSLAGVGLWIGWSVTGDGAGGPFGVYAALLAFVLGTLFVYIGADPDAVR